MKVFLSIFTLLFAFYAGIAAPITSGGIAGIWTYSVDTPNGLYKGKMIFTQTDEGYAGKMVSDAGEVSLQDLKVEDNNFSFSLTVEGYPVKITGSVDGDVLKGKVEVEYEFYTINGKRIPEEKEIKKDGLAGNWNFTTTPPDGAVYKGKFILDRNGEGYTGKMVIGESETELKDVKLEGNQLSFSLYAQGYFIKIKGKIDGTTFDGKGEVESEYFPVKAEKASD